MPSFTEYVHLIAEGNEAIAVINKINEAIAKMRREAASPINVKINPENEKQANSKRQQRSEKLSADQKELELLRKKKEEIAAIKAMNKEVGNPSFAIRYGNQESIAQNQRYSEQLAETTRRINRIADAHKHVAAVAKQADVEVSASLAEKLATQTATRTEKDEAQSIREAAKAAAEREKQMAYGLTRDMQIKTEALREQERIEKSIAAANKQRLNEELTGERIVTQMKKEQERLQEKERREARQAQAAVERAEARARRERETQIASAREGGIRGVVGEWQRDLRRKSIYGTLNTAENLIGHGFEAGLDRSKEIEQQYQTGRSPQERKSIEDRAQQYSDKYAMMSKTEGMVLQRHAMGEVADFKGGQGLADIAAPFVALRTSAIGAEQALTENQKIMKGFNELGWVKSPEKMKAAYESLARMGQVEGANFEPESWLQIIRMAKSAKFAMSDEAMMKLAPLISIGEGAGRAGNEFAMLFKTLAFSGKALDNSIGKTNHLQYVDGTVLSDNKGGFNPELARDVASGTPEGIKKFNALLDSAAKSKGVNPENALDFKQWLTHVFANQSAQELAMWFHEKEDFVEKQLGMYSKARGTEANQGIENRDINSAIAGAKAKFSDATSAIMEPFKKEILGVINMARGAEQWTAAHPMGGLGITGGLAVAGGVALAQSAYENPGQAAQIGLLTSIAANTAATAANTGVAAAEGAASGGLGMIGKLGIAAGAVAAAYDVYQGVSDLKQWWENKKLKDAAQSPEGIAAYNKNTIEDDQKAVKFAQAQADAHAKQMQNTPTPRGYTDIIGKQIADALAAAIAKLEADKAHPLKFNQAEKDQINGVKGAGLPGATPLMHVGPTTGENYGSMTLSKIDTAVTGGVALEKSTATDAVSKLHSAGTEMAGALAGAGDSVKGGASAAAGSIAAGGEAVAGALNQAAAAIAAAGARAAASGTPQVAPQNTGQSARGPR